MKKHPEEYKRIGVALSFLAASPQEKIITLNFLPKTADYRDNDGAVATLHSTELCLRSCAIVLSRNAWLVEGKLRQLLVDLDCMIQITLALGESVADYHYFIDKTECPVSGPFDNVWSIMARLADEALRCGGAYLAEGKIDGRVLLESSGFKLVDPR